MAMEYRIGIGAGAVIGLILGGAIGHFLFESLGWGLVIGGLLGGAIGAFITMAFQSRKR